MLFSVCIRLLGRDGLQLKQPDFKNFSHPSQTLARNLNKDIQMVGVLLPAEMVPVAELLLCGVRRNIVVQVNELREEKLDDLCSHHYRGFSSKSAQGSQQTFVPFLTRTSGDNN